MKTANDMKKIANEKKLGTINKILIDIEKAARKGELEMWWYEDITSEQRAELALLGFEVGKTEFDRNEYLTKIKW